MNKIDFDNPYPLLGIITEAVQDEILPFRWYLRIYCYKYKVYFSIRYADGPLLSPNSGCVFYSGNMTICDSPIPIDRMVHIEIPFPSFYRNRYRHFYPMVGSRVRIYTSKSS